MRTIRDGEPRTAISIFTQLLSSERKGSVQCCFTSTETVRTVRDWEPRTATSTFAQLLSSEEKPFVQCCFTSTETVRTIRDGEPRPATSAFFFGVALRQQRPCGLLGTGGTQDGHLDFHTAPELCRRKAETDKLYIAVYSRPAISGRHARGRVASQPALAPLIS